MTKFGGWLARKYPRSDENAARSEDVIGNECDHGGRHCWAQMKSLEWGSYLAVDLVGGRSPMPENGRKGGGDI